MERSRSRSQRDYWWRRSGVFTRRHGGDDGIHGQTKGDQILSVSLLDLNHSHLCNSFLNEHFRGMLCMANADDIMSQLVGFPTLGYRCVTKE